MQLANVIRWPIRSRNGWHDCKKCGRRLHWEWVWRCVSVKEEHRTPYLPIVFERHKQQDLFLCKLCTPTRQNAQFYVLDKGWIKRPKPAHKAVEHDLAYNNINPKYNNALRGGAINPGMIEAKHISAGQITVGSMPVLDSSGYCESGVALYELGTYEPVDYVPTYPEVYTTGRKAPLHPTGGSQPEKHRLSVVEDDGVKHEHEFATVNELELYMDMMGKRVKKKSNTLTTSTGPR